MTYSSWGNRKFADADSGLVLRIQNGIVAGCFQIEPSDHQINSFQSIYANKCSYLFQARNGILIYYHALVQPWFFWCRSVLRAKEHMEGFVSQYDFECLIDTREYYNVKLDTGRLLRGFFKYTIVRFAFMWREHDLLVRVTVQVVDPKSDVPARWETFSSVIPLENFLWLNHQDEGVLATSLRRSPNERSGLPESPIDVLEPT